MISLGHKKHNIKTMGQKNYYLNYIGHKVIDRSNAKGQIKEHLKDGLIQNYSNHPYSISEPIKGVDYKPKQNNYVIEKPQKSKNDKSNYA